MKQSMNWLITWWFDTMAPSHTPLTTIDERENLRKRRLLSGILFLNFSILACFFLLGWVLRGAIIPQISNGFGCVFLLSMLWLNKRGYLKSTSFLTAFYTVFSMFAAIISFSLIQPVLSLVLWAMLLPVPVSVGLLLPAWGPLILAFVEIVFMNWFVLNERQSQLLAYMPAAGDRLIFLFFTCCIIFVMGIFSAVYANTTKKAVIQADRATELEIAHQTISVAYTDLEQAHVTIQKQALMDGLTGLPNRRALINQLEKELERTQRYERPFSLLFFDADRFKHVNDTHGHGAGDAVLRQIGERAGSALRGGDTLGRFGGEEFVVLLPEADSSEAAIVAERIRATVASKVVATEEVEGGITMTVSIGIATYRIDGKSEQELLSQADEAMYMAKRMGRNQVRTAEEARQMGTDVDLMALLQEEVQREIAQREGITPERLRETYMLRCIYSLLSLLERRDAGLSAHAHGVSDLATKIAQTSGLEAKEVTRIGIAALLHDIGKVAVPDRLLQKTVPLSAHERVVVQEHAELGAQILEANPILFDLAPVVRYHHERWDGSGYPKQLAGEDIPLGARIIAVAGAYDAMRRGHEYQASRSPEEALAELRRCTGSQFDPGLVRIMAEVVAEERSLQVIG